MSSRVSSSSWVRSPVDTEERRATMASITCWLSWEESPPLWVRSRAYWSCSFSMVRLCSSSFRARPESFW